MQGCLILMGENNCQSHVYPSFLLSLSDRNGSCNPFTVVVLICTSSLLCSVPVCILDTAAAFAAGQHLDYRPSSSSCPSTISI